MPHESFAGRQFYHGTSEFGVQGIPRDGAKPSKRGAWGPGFYTTDNLDVAEVYSDGGGGGIFEGKSLAQNPKVFDTAGQVDQYLGIHEPGELTKLAADEGHDAVYLGHRGLMILLNHGDFHPTAFRGTRPGNPTLPEDRRPPAPGWIDLT